MDRGSRSDGEIGSLFSMRSLLAVVSGGASGIGAETARTFALHGAAVVLCDVQDDLGLLVAREIADNGGNVPKELLD